LQAQRSVQVLTNRFHSPPASDSRNQP
jgi:hypothetical protein